MESSVRKAFPWARLETHDTLVQVIVPYSVYQTVREEQMHKAGYTANMGTGVWRGPKGREAEDVVTITMSGHTQPVSEALAQLICHAFEHGEQAVYVIIDGVAHIYHKE